MYITNKPHRGCITYDFETSGLSRRDLLNVVYLILIRLVCEYACQMWTPSLATDQYSANVHVNPKASIEY